MIEDETVLRMMLQRLLVSQGYEVLIADRFQTAEQQIREQQKADLVLMDLNLPGGTGFDLIRLIRDSWGVPVIVLSGMKQESSVVRALEEGAVDFMQKPFSPQELITRLKRYMPCGDVSA
ncbi:response regulator transcription factor [Deinococcus cellulosilyticus]|uniref:Response regulatory domain-containing protein n=1 Tax=Deinococcus cellulosilyticus (strain DSM 18568 / NBRC 106333 / KACC 11606 / 5516J-15) TaxID=1223518 RepID=A0A511NB49_DEIC1|nr:response regulator transcription factor [Deinococcus cellulosilyticus]GEM49611.1 hypothetical protein DC3_52460 [Deinococcus cellulosilyticus NBRC 106333 = KACC 11606]